MSISKYLRSMEVGQFRKWSVYSEYTFTLWAMGITIIFNQRLFINLIFYLEKTDKILSIYRII